MTIHKGKAHLEPIAPGLCRVAGFFPSQFLAIQTTRAGGGSVGPYASFNLATHVGDAPGAVADNRARLSRYCSSEPLWLDQVHGVEVATAGGRPHGQTLSTPPKADASITDQAGLACLVLTADCLPILVARPATGQVAAIHAGWRGLCEGVIEATLGRLADQAARHRQEPLATPVGGKAQDSWYLWLGPAIGQSAFEVGNEVFEAFVKKNAAAKQAFVRSNHDQNKWLADLKSLAEQRIEAWFTQSPLGESAQVYVAADPACVFHDAAQYFSYRRDRMTGRMASLITRI